MNIATWNIERLKHKRDLDKIVQCCNQINADILILTETDDRVRPDYKYCFSTPALSGLDSKHYKSTENRVSIYSNYAPTRQYPTYDEYTALCIGFETEYGELLIYGTIIGIYGNRHSNFKNDLSKQLEDIKRLAENGNICVAGDYNISFYDNYYYTNDGRNSILKTFSDEEISIITADVLSCIDHIAISQDIVSGKTITINEWNIDKRLSDHKGIVVNIN